MSLEKAYPRDAKDAPKPRFNAIGTNQLSVAQAQRSQEAFAIQLPVLVPYRLKSAIASSVACIKLHLLIT